MDEEEDLLAMTTANGGAVAIAGLTEDSLAKHDKILPPAKSGLLRRSLSQSPPPLALEVGEGTGGAVHEEDNVQHGKAVTQQPPPTTVDEATARYAAPGAEQPAQTQPWQGSMFATAELRVGNRSRATVSARSRTRGTV